MHKHPLNKFIPLIALAICTHDKNDKNKLPHWLRGSNKWRSSGKSEIRHNIIQKAKRRTKNGKHKSAAKATRYLERIGTENRI